MNQLPIDRVIGLNLKRVRSGRGMTQATLACELVPARTHAAVSDMERGKTTFSADLLLQLSRIFGMAPADWFAAIEACPTCGRPWPE